MGPPTLDVIYTKTITSPAFWVGVKGEVRTFPEFVARALILDGSAIEYKGKEEKDVK